MNKVGKSCSKFLNWINIYSKKYSGSAVKMIIFSKKRFINKIKNWIRLLELYLIEQKLFWINI